MYDIELESPVFRRKEVQCIFKYFWFDVVVCGNDNLDHANQEIIISSGRILRKVKKKIIIIITTTNFATKNKKKYLFSR